MTQTTYIPRDEYRIVHLYLNNDINLFSPCNETAYWAISNKESDMLIEDVEWKTVGPRPLNAGDVGAIKTSGSDFKPVRYNSSPYNWPYSTDENDYYIRARGGSLVVEVTKK